MQSPGMPEATPQAPSSLELLHTFTPASPSRAWCTAPHPTLPLLATCHADRSVRVYSLASQTLLSTINGGHKRSIRCCAWKPNLKGESVLATGSFDASVGIWRHWDTTADYGGLSMMAPKKTKGRKFVGDDEGLEEEVDDDDDDEEWNFALVLDGHDSEVKGVAYSAGGNLLATCSRDKSVWIWEEVGDDDYETVAVLQEHEGDVKTVAWHPEEELLVSGSYDDEVRLWREEIDDWGCVGVIKGHSGTVWSVAWEAPKPKVAGDERQDLSKPWMARREQAGPRLLTASADMTVRVWRRLPKEKTPQSKLSIIRSGNNAEEWVEECVLPRVHTQAIYAASWSNSGRIVSAGGDGTVVVYEEIWVSEGDATEWIIIAQMDAAHGVFEVNHTVWTSKRAPGQGGKVIGDGEERIISTGDDGCVKVWALRS